MTAGSTLEPSRNTPPTCRAPPSLQLALEPGDVIILATDGLFDNMWDEQLVSLAAAASSTVPATAVGAFAVAAGQSAAQQLATTLVATAFRQAQDPAGRTPWAVELANQASVRGNRGRVNGRGGGGVGA